MNESLLLLLLLLMCILLLWVKYVFSP